MIVAAVDSIGVMIGAAVLDVPFVLAIGVLVFLGAFVPLIGATIAGTVAVLVALVDQGPLTALLMLAVVIGVQQLEGHVLQPFLLGRWVALHPLGVILAIAGGVLVAGIVGALVAVPLAAAANAVVLPPGRARRRCPPRKRPTSSRTTSSTHHDEASRCLNPTVTLADIEAARPLVDSVAVRTPMVESRWLSALAGVPVHLKCENLQRTGSFKVRGSAVRIARLSDEERALGVVAASAGNHAQGVALAAQQHGIAATVFMPDGAPIPKERATRGYGADVRFTPGVLEDCLAAATETRCSMCHMSEPVWPGIHWAPNHVLLQSPENIGRHARLIEINAVRSDAMPPGNITGMTPEERLILARHGSRPARRRSERNDLLIPISARSHRLRPHAARSALAGRARVAVQFVINYEEGGENSILHGDKASEAFLSESSARSPGPASAT